MTTSTQNTKTTEIENKIFTNLTTKAALNTKATEAENKIPDAIGFITAPEFNRLTKINFDARMIQETKSLANKTKVDATLSTDDKKQMFDLSYFNGRRHFDDDRSQNYFVSQLVILKQS